MILRRIRLLSFAAVPVCATVVSLGALASPAGAATALPRNGYCGVIDARMDRHLSSANVHYEIANQAVYDGDYELADYNYDIADQAMNAYWADVATSIAYGC
jgi:hypothetical protein